MVEFSCVATWSEGEEEERTVEGRVGEGVERWGGEGVQVAADVAERHRVEAMKAGFYWYHHELAKLKKR